MDRLYFYLFYCRMEVSSLCASVSCGYLPHLVPVHGREVTLGTAWECLHLETLLTWRCEHALGNSTSFVSDLLPAAAAATSSTSTSSTQCPNFIGPRVNLMVGCNIFDPLCQTGNIIVDVDVTTTRTTTEVPCSYFLSAQSASA